MYVKRKKVQGEMECASREQQVLELCCVVALRGREQLGAICQIKKVESTT